MLMLHYFNLVIVLSWLIWPAKQTVGLLAEYYPSLVGYQFHSVQAATTHVVAILGQLNAEVILAFYPANNLASPTELQVTGLVFDPTAKIRTAQFNTYTSIQSSSLLYFTNTTIILFPYFLDYYTEIFTTTSSPSLLIKQTCFGPTKDLVLILAHQTSSNLYYILMYDVPSKGFVNKVELTAVDAGVNKVDQFGCFGGIVVVMFSQGLWVYGVVGVDLVEMYWTKYGSMFGEYMDVKVDGDLLVYSVGADLHLHNLTTSSHITTQTLPTLIQSLTILPSYILLKTTTQIHQYDYQIFQTIHSLAITYRYSTLQKLWTLENGRIVGFHLYGSQAVGDFQVLGVSWEYGVGGNWCFGGYQLVGTTCVKTVSNTTNTSTLAPTTTNTTTINNTSTTNTTTNTTSIPTSTNTTSISSTSTIPTATNTSTSTSTTPTSTNTTTSTTNTTSSPLTSPTSTNTTSSPTTSSTTPTSTSTSTSSPTSSIGTSSTAPSNTGTVTPTNTSTTTNPTNTSTTTTTTPSTNTSATANSTIVIGGNTGSVTNVGATGSVLGVEEEVEKLLEILASNSFGYIFSVSAIRAMPKFILVFTLLINDLAYYKQHRKFQPEYPNSTLIFMQKFDLLKQLGMQSFSSYFPFLPSTPQILTSSNTNLLTYLQFTAHDPQQIYFLSSTTDFYQTSLFQNFLYFLIFKLVHYLLYLVKDWHWVLRKGYRFVRDQTRWWVFVVAVVEINGVEVVFDAGLQFLGVGVFGWFDRVNLGVMYVVLFGIVFYVLCFYSLVYAKENRKCSKNLIIYSKNRMRSFFFQPILFLLRGIIKSFLHGYLLPSYPTQITSLFITDLTFLTICLLLAQNFLNKPILTLITSYLLGFTLFDLFFLLQIHTSLTQSWDREIVGFGLCVGLAVISFMLCVVFFLASVVDVIGVVKGLVWDNRVGDQGREVSFQEFNLKKCDKIVGVIRNNQVELNNLYENMADYNDKQLQNKDITQLIHTSNTIKKSNKKYDRTRKVLKQRRRKSIERYNLKIITNQVPIEQKERLEKLHVFREAKIYKYKEKYRYQGENTDANSNSYQDGDGDD